MRTKLWVWVLEAAVEGEMRVCTQLYLKVLFVRRGSLHSCKLRLKIVREDHRTISFPHSFRRRAANTEGRQPGPRRDCWYSITQNSTSVDSGENQPRRPGSGTIRT